MIHENPIILTKIDKKRWYRIFLLQNTLFFVSFKVFYKK